MLTSWSLATGSPGALLATQINQARSWQPPQYIFPNTAQQTIRRINDGLTLVQRLRCWTNVKLTLIQRLVSVGWASDQSWLCDGCKLYLFSVEAKLDFCIHGLLVHLLSGRMNHNHSLSGMRRHHSRRLSQR